MLSLRCAARTATSSLRSASASVSIASTSTIRRSTSPTSQLISVSAFSSSSSSSSSSSTPSYLDTVAAWKNGRALVDLTSVLEITRPDQRARQYERFLTQYALYDSAPVHVLKFWLVNKPADTPRSTLQYNVLIHLLAFRVNDVDAAVTIFQQMLAEKVSPNEVTFQFLIGAQASRGAFKEAEALLAQMASFHLHPSAIHYQILITAYATKGQQVQAEALVATLKKERDATPGLSTQAALLAMYKKLASIPSDAKKYETRIKELQAAVKALKDVESLQQPYESVGVQRGQFKPVTSTGVTEDKSAKPAPKKK